MNSLRYLTACLTLAAAAILAWQPVQWLVGSWQLPGYPSNGPWVMAVVALLLLWSISSRRTSPRSTSHHYLGLGLLVLSALLRALAQLADINLLGATVLAVDLYAVALLLGVAQRGRAIASLWLAALFCFALPIEPWLQRLFGAPLQWLSAQGACGLLSLVTADLRCNGVRLQVDGVDVLVDLPCSGSQLLTQAGLLFCLLQTLRPLNTWQSAKVMLVTLAMVWFANALRITLLALGIVHEPFALNLMAPPWHDAVGLVGFGMVAAVVVLLYRHAATANSVALPRSVRSRIKARRFKGTNPLPRRFGQRGQLAAPIAATLFLSAAAIIVDLEPDPIDRSEPLAPPYAPAVLGDERRMSVGLSKQEQRYYQTYGGSASKTAYGPFGLLLVNTRAPIRHLHAPELCLAGMGFEVTFLGTEFAPVPTAVYLATDPSSGQPWQVRVSYQSASGDIVASVSDLVWRWLRAPNESWHMVQRLVPLPANADLNRIPVNAKTRLPNAAIAWEAAVVRAFNLLEATDST